MRIQTLLYCDLCTQNPNECDALTHIKSDIHLEEDGMILIAIPLGKDQFDLAVDQAIVPRIRHYLTDRSNLRLLSSDPLFAAEYGRSYPETAFHALTQMISQYNNAASSVYMSNDPRLTNWFVAETKRLDMLLKHYQEQVNCPKVDQ
ncbi:hypothetical protein N7524_011725 [Penicillium chrysogenum]|nr:hypothetical protein N7524_011725 [Penicillium chrysogenum]